MDLHTFCQRQSGIQLFLLVYGLKLVQGWVFSPTPTRVCYGTLGCFSSKKPYSSLPLPHDPDVIGTRFILHTRNSTHRFQELVIADNKSRCSWRTFCRKRDTKLIIHGYFDDAEKPWVKEMVKAILKHKDYNVITVDWKPGARDIHYLQSAANIRVVGAQVAQLIEVLMEVYKISPGSVHIIGHSLGAHAAGYVGEYLEGIGRITGLDPAGPSFEGEDPAARLDETDADFVDVIHTDGEHLVRLGFGLMSPIGDIDVYPNDGQNQPGCPTTYSDQMHLLFTGDFEVVKNVGCSHLRVLDLFTESINSQCEFTSYPCDTVNHSDKCTRCGTEGCVPMGFHLSAEHTHKRGIFVLTTHGDSPYCIQPSTKTSYGPREIKPDDRTDTENGS